MNVTTGKGFSLMKNTTRNYLVKRFRPVVIFIHRHHPARLLYAFFVFIVLAVIGSILEAFFQFGKLPGLSDFQKTYVFQVAIDFPYFSVPFIQALTEEIKQNIHIQKVESNEWTPPRDTAILPLPPASSGLVGRATEQQWL